MLGDTNYNSDAWLGFKKALLSKIGWKEKLLCYKTAAGASFYAHNNRDTLDKISRTQGINLPMFHANRDVFKVKVNR